MIRKFIWCLLVPAVYGQTPSTEQLRGSATRSIVIIQRGVAGFVKAQECFSCHSHGLPALAFRTAREHGVAVDETGARAMVEKGLSQTTDLTSIDNALQNHMIIDPSLSQGWALVAAHAAGVAPSLAAAIHARQIANWQRADGHWTTLDARPPQSDSVVTATAISVRAIQLYMPSGLRNETNDRVGRARGWLLAFKPKTTEDHTYRLLGLLWAGATSAERTAATKDLVALQRPNGGWAQLPRMGPDAYATGEVLVALHEAGGMPVSDPAWQKGLRFLLSTQAADGSWRVATRNISPAQVSPPYFETGFPHGKDQMISIMGTTWAAMALMTALPKVDRPAQPLPHQIVPKDVQPWMETALFGSSAQLKALLDGGLSANTKTAAGTTLLMFAATDPAKVKLLIERGADVKAKAASGYTALMIASMYRGTGDSVKLLLSKGAEAAPGNGVKFNASPLVLAAMAGDTENIAQLRAKCADSKRKMVLLGAAPNSAFFAATLFGEPEAVKAMLAAGGDPREVDQDGMNALHWASLSGRAEAARILAAAGTPLNQTDKYGFTPLMYAATVDYGSAEMVKILRAAGADASVRTKDGKTALSQSKLFGYPYISEALK